jgi:hypothetical protein
MRKAEQVLWDAMRPKRPPRVWLQRIENLVGDGIPDVYAVRSGGIASWVELKAPKRPRRASTRLLGAEGLRTSQINWHVKAASMNLRSYVLVRDDHGELSLLEGVGADQMNDWTREQVLEESLADTWKLIYEAIL